jgi:hypothetical protein
MMSQVQLDCTVGGAGGDECDLGDDLYDVNV